MKLKLKSRIIAAAMSLAMVFTMMPMMGQAVYAEPAGDPAINLVENGSAPNIAGAQTSSIWFGDYKQSPDGSGDHNKEPIKWRVLSNESGELFLLSDQNLDCKKYNDTSAPVTWKTSTIRTWLNGDFMSTAFSSGEQSAIKTTDVVNDNNPDHDTPGGENTQDQIFLLSIAEATNEKYGFTNNYNDTPTREAKNTAYATWQGAWTVASGQYAGNGNWWLRSPGGSDHGAAVVGGGGYLNSYGNNVDDVNNTVRPAFNFNLKSVIFTSAAEDSKYSGTVGAESLKEVGTNTTGEWKVTLKSGHDSFAVDSVTTCDGKTLNIEYSGAVKGDWEYISAIIKDKDGKVKYYGKLKNCTEDTDASGTVKINVDGKLGADDTLCVFNEQLNGTRKTDFASGLIQLTIPEAGHDYRHEYVNDEYHKNTCIACGEETTERHTYSYGICVVCNGRCSHSSLSDSYGNNSEWHWKECEYCSLKFDEEKHKWQDEWTADGTKHWHECEVCQRKKDEEEHKWDAGKVTKAATEKQAGTKTFTCTVCKATKTETIPKLKPSAPKISGTPLAKLTAKSKSITISWNKIQGVAGYDIFFARCNHDNKKIVTKKVKTIKGNKTFKWTKSGLKKGTAYKAYVRAYVYKNGKKTYVRNSPLMHAYTGNGTKNYTNAKSVKLKNVKKGKLSLKKGKTFKIKAKVIKINKKKKLMPTGHAPTLRYLTSNKKVATVSKSGKITAKGKGTCYIYVYAHNGVSKQVRITVK